MRKSAWLALALGGLLLLVGLVLGFVPVSAGGSSCGSAFVASDSALADDYSAVLSGGSLNDATRAADCDSARSMWRVPALALSLPGALALAVAGFVLLDLNTGRLPRGPVTGHESPQRQRGHVDN